MSYQIIFPDKYLTDKYLQFERECKGWFELEIVVADTSYTIMFFDPTRLQQDIDVEWESGRNFWFEPNMVVVKSVKIDVITEVVEELLAKGAFKFMRSNL